MDKKIDAVIQILRDWNNSDLINAWNEYCDDKGSSDNRVYMMCEFNDFFNHLTPLDIIEMVEHTTFYTNSDYFAYDNYGRLVSFDDVEDYYCFDFTELAEYLTENGDNNTEEVDRDELLSLLYDAMEIGDRTSNSLNQDVLMNVLEKFIENNDHDILTGDWDEITGEFVEYLHTDYNEDNEEED